MQEGRAPHQGSGANLQRGVGKVPRTGFPLSWKVSESQGIKEVRQKSEFCL